MSFCSVSYRVIPGIFFKRHNVGGAVWFGVSQSDSLHICASFLHDTELPRKGGRKKGNQIKSTRYIFLFKAFISLAFLNSASSLIPVWSGQREGVSHGTPPWHSCTPWILLQGLIPCADSFIFAYSQSCASLFSHGVITRWESTKGPSGQGFVVLREHPRALPIPKARTWVANSDPGEAAAEVIKHYEITGTTISGTLGAPWDSLQ